MIEKYVWKSQILFWSGSDSAHPFWSGPKLSGPANNGEVVHCSREQWRKDGCRRTRKRRRRRRRAGKGWPSSNADGGAGGFSSKWGGRALGAASPADGSSYSALCAFPLVLLPFFLFCFLYLCFCSNSSLSFLFLFCYFFFPFLSSLFVYVSLYSLLFVSSLFSFYFSPLKLPKSIVSIPPSSLSFTSSVISFFFSRVFLSIMSLCFFFSSGSQTISPRLISSLQNPLLLCSPRSGI